MSRSTVRTAVATFFTAPPITQLNKVYRTQPRLAAPNVFYDGTGTQMGAIAFVHLDHDLEHRITGPAPQPGIIPTSQAGWKRVIYDVALVTMFRSLQANQAGDGSDPNEVAFDAIDALIERMKARLRSDRTLGNAVFSAGEGTEQRLDDVRLTQDFAVADADVAFQDVFALRFLVTEWIQS